MEEEDEEEEGHEGAWPACRIVVSDLLPEEFEEHEGVCSNEMEE